MRRVVFDTDVFSEILKGVSAPIRKRARAYRAAFGCYTITSTTVMEMVYGRRKNGDEPALENLRQAFGHTSVLGFDQEAAWLAGQINLDLERARTTIGCEDPLIAAIAITRDLPLVTGNARHFEHVRELGHSLVIELWT